MAIIENLIDNMNTGGNGVLPGPFPGVDLDPQQQQQCQQLAMAAAAHHYQQHQMNNHHHHPLSSSFGTSFSDDIRKCGYMKKQKTNKRKFFVLRLNSNVTLSRATLSYYDNEKKFRDKIPPRRKILLTECFAVARIPDHKKFLLGIYTKEDLLSTVLDDEQQLFEWLEAIRSILYRTFEYQSRPLKDFQYIWQGSINRVSSGMPKNLIGLYRFCLMPTVLYLIRVDPNVENPKHYEFPLSIIHLCGHKERTFYLRIGRLSEIGAGEFWIVTDDNTIAEHMHGKVSSFWNLNNSNNNSKGRKSSSLDNNSTTTTTSDNKDSESQQDHHCHIQGSQSTTSSTTSLSITSLSTTSTLSSSSQHRPRSSSTSIAIDNNNKLSSTATPTTNPNNNIYANHNNNNPTTTTPSSIPFLHSLQHNHAQMPPPPPFIIQFMQQFHGHGHHVPGGGLHFPFCHNVTKSNGGSVAQSPTTSRERLHSLGSWSRTASDCSQEEMSECLSVGSCSSQATTPIGQPLYWDLYSPTNNNNISTSTINSHTYKSSDNNNHKQANHSSTSSLCTEYNDDAMSMFQMDQFNVSSPHSHCYYENNNSHQQTISMNSSTSSEERGYGAELDLYSSSTSTTTPAPTTAPPFCQSCLQQYSLYLQMLQQQHSNAYHQRSSSSSSSHQQTSPITSPKCHCSSCLLYHHGSSGGSNPYCMNNNNNNGSGSSCHHYLPTIPAGEPSDYVPMKPINTAANNTSNDNPIKQTNATTSQINNGDNVELQPPQTKMSSLIVNGQQTNNQSGSNEDDEESSYLHMAPLSPGSLNYLKDDDQENEDKMKSENKNASNSIEYNLEKVRSYISNEDETKTTIAEVSMNSTDISGDNTIFNGLTRAYSTGSKPQPLAPSIGAQCTTGPSPTTTTNAPNQNNNISDPKQIDSTAPNSGSSTNGILRMRASSTGSHGMKFRAFLPKRSKAKQIQQLQQQQQQIVHQRPHISSPQNDCWTMAGAMHHGLSAMVMGSSCSLSTNPDQQQLTNCQGLQKTIQGQKTNKAASAPILSSFAQPRVRSLTLGSKPSMNHSCGSGLKSGTANGTIGSTVSVNPPAGHSTNNPYWMSPQMTDYLRNLYGVAVAMRSINPYCTHLPYFTHHPLSPPGSGLQQTQSQGSSQAQQPPPIAPQISLPEEGDLMEIDYSAKNKDKDNSTTSSTTTNNARSQHQRQNNVLQNDDQLKLQQETAIGRKRSDSSGSNSTLANFFNGSAAGSSSTNHSNSKISTSNHHHKLDKVVNTFKHLSFNGKHKKSSNDSQHLETGNETNHHYKLPADDEESEYILLGPVGSKPGKTSVIISLSSSSPKKAESDLSSEPSKTNPIQSNRLSSTTTAPLATNESDVDCDDIEDEEESSYVLMAPENATTSSSSNKASSGKKHKSNVRSIGHFISSISGSSSLPSSSSSNGSRFRINRSNSSSNSLFFSGFKTGNLQNKRKGSSKSESSSTIKTSTIDNKESTEHFRRPSSNSPTTVVKSAIIT